MPVPPLRILTFLHSFEPGGVEKVALRLATAWQDARAEVRVVLGRAEGAMRTGAPALDYEVLQTGSFSTAWCETLWMSVKLPAAVRRYRPNVIFCAGNTYAIVAIVLRLALGNECPPIVMKVSNDLVRRDMPRPLRWLYRRWLEVQGAWIDAFVGIAAPMRSEMREAFRIPDNRIRIVNDPAIDNGDIGQLFARRREAVRRHSGVRYLAVGRLVAQKNFALLIEAFADIASAQDRLTILGEGPQRRALERLAQRLGVGDRVALPGHGDTLDWLTDADVFVLSSVFEGVPAVVVEALAAGLPIVATDCSVSMSSLLDEGRLGTLVPVGDRTALAQAMAKPLAACPSCCRMQASHFTIERAAPQYLAALGQIAGRPVAGRRLDTSVTTRCAACRVSRRLDAETQRLKNA